MSDDAGERPLARGVAARQRFARIFALGDRRSPSSWTPGLVLGPTDPELPLSMAAFRVNRDASTIPATMSMDVLDDLCLPFGGLETWQAEE